MTEKILFRLWPAAVFLSFSLIITHASLSCPLCFPFPVKSAADYLFENELVVFAELNPEDRFSYVITRVLKGNAETKELDYFVDSTTRRRLNANPGNVVVFVRGKQADDWRCLGIADGKYQQVVERIVAHQHIWSQKQGDQKRIEFFMRLFDHENQAIFELAYLELARAPYSTIQKVGRVISKERIRSLLNRREYVEWRPLAILLLAQNPDEADRDFIERSFANCKTFPRENELAAWATAYIELNGQSAVEEIEATWLRDREPSEAELRAVIMALSVQGHAGDIDLRDRITDSYRIVLRVHPEFAGPIAADLTQWDRWECGDEVAAILKKEDIAFENSDANVMRTYISRSKGAVDQNNNNNLH